MSTVNIVNELLAELSAQPRQAQGNQLGQELVLDEDGYLALDFAGRLSITLFCPANSDRLVLYSGLLALPARNEAAAPLLRELLRQNMPEMLHTDERLALEGDTVYLVLEKTVDAQANRLTAAELHSLLLSFAADADSLALALREYAAASSAPAASQGAGGWAQYEQPFLIRV
ncbi:hypothetical protein AGMMS50256_01910 [Betaproteobacteria bacterium]|nr:hypothetical protein AGMMS50256_01910 [Betaproteobacteria bacterium]